MRVARHALAALVGLFVVACDRPAPPPPDAPPPPAKKEPAPTTQQILDGPRKPLGLGVLPFTADVPQGWSVPRREPAMLEGPIVGGEVHVLLRVRENLSPERIKTLTDHLRTERPTIEKAGGLLSIRDLGEVRIIERREPPRPPTTRLAALAADPIQGEPALTWRVTLFSPAGVNYEQYELQFIDLTPSEFAANQKLLEAVIASLKPDATATPPL